MTEQLFNRLKQEAQTGGINTEADSDGLTRFTRHCMRWLVTPQIKTELSKEAGLNFIKRDNLYQIYGLAEKLGEAHMAELERDILQKMAITPAKCCAR